MRGPDLTTTAAHEEKGVGGGVDEAVGTGGGLDADRAGDVVEGAGGGFEVVGAVGGGEALVIEGGGDDDVAGEGEVAGIGVVLDVIGVYAAGGGGSAGGDDNVAVQDDEAGAIGLGVGFDGGGIGLDGGEDRDGEGVGRGVGEWCFGLDWGMYLSRHLGRGEMRVKRWAGHDSYEEVTDEPAPPELLSGRPGPACIRHNPRLNDFTKAGLV